MLLHIIHLIESASIQYFYNKAFYNFREKFFTFLTNLINHSETNSLLFYTQLLEEKGEYHKFWYYDRPLHFFFRKDR